MRRKVPTWSRAEYEAALAAGRRFKPAGFYEADHAPPDAFFVMVRLSRDLVRYMREVKPGR